MDSLSQTSTLLILTSREDEAEGLIKSLRDGGLAVRGSFTSDPEQLYTFAEAGGFELILCCEYDPGIDVDLFLSHYRELEMDVPLIVVAEEATRSSLLIEVMRAGARDLTEQGAKDHLQLVVARELADFQHRRNERYLSERLSECEKRSRDLIDATGEAIAFIQEGIHVQVNPAYQELFHFHHADYLDGFPLLDLVAPDFQQQVGDKLRTVERQGTIVPLELDVDCLREDGEGFKAHLTISRSVIEGEPCVRVIAQAVTAQAPTTQSFPSTIDADTQLPNRSALIHELDSRIEPLEADDDTPLKPFAVIYIRIHAFPGLLETRGLTSGLRAVAEIGTQLTAKIPAGGYVARVADDAFILLVSDIKKPDAEALATEIRGSVRLELDEESSDPDSSYCGTGLVFVESRDRSSSQVLDSAFSNYLQSTVGPETKALVSAQPEAAKDDEEGELASEDERRLAGEIQQALDNDDLLLAYQPLVSLRGDSQESYSVLVRMREADSSMREAKAFLSTAIKAGKMVAIDRWVIRAAIGELASQRDQGQKVRFFINIAEATLLQDKLLIWICDSLQELEARGNWLTIQVMEEHARRHTEAFTRLCEGLRKVSCQVSLNRFGEGPDPAGLLRSLKVDYVRLPPDLGQGLADNKAKQQRLKELTALCREANIKSIVTGVEDARSLTLLWTAGIDYVQGNFLQSASPALRQPRST